MFPRCTVWMGKRGRTCDIQCGQRAALNVRIRLPITPTGIVHAPPGLVSYHRRVQVAVAWRARARSAMGDGKFAHFQRCSLARRREGLCDVSSCTTLTANLLAGVSSHRVGRSTGMFWSNEIDPLAYAGLPAVLSLTHCG